MKTLIKPPGRNATSFTILCIVLSLMAFTGVRSQNVGIGTQTPDQKLEVDGNIKLGDNMMVEGSNALRVYRNLATYSSSTTSIGAFVINTNILSNSNCMWSLTVKGYEYSSSSLFEVTIGSYNLSGHDGYIYEGDFKLDVRTANVTATGYMVIILGSESDSYGYPKLLVSECRIGHCGRNEARADGWSITRATDLSAFNSITTIENAGDFTWVENGDDIYYNNGKVGIGTTSPNYKLRVDENSGAASTRAIFGYNLSTATNGYMNGVVGETRTNATVNAGSGVVGINSSTIGNGNGVKGESYGSGSRGVYGYVSHTSGTNYAIYGKTASNNGYAGYFEGGKNYFEGRVGIGTTSPEEKLHVDGNLKISDSFPILSINSTSTAGQSTILFEEGTAKKSLYYSNPTRAFLLYDYTRSEFDFMIDSAGKVGIGTTSPEQELHVEGNIKATDVAPLLVLNSSSPTGASSIMFSQGPTKKSLFYNHDIDKLLIYDYTRHQYDFTIDSDGDVGIGTTTPDHELHVMGNIKATGTSSHLILNATNFTGFSSILFTHDVTKKSLYYSNSSGNLYIYDYDRDEFDLTINSDGDIVAGRAFITGATNGVINAGGATHTNVNVIGDNNPTGNGIVAGDEDLYIEDDLELDGQGYKPGGGSWGTVSDARLKKNIRDYSDGLSTLLQIEPVSYEYNNTLKKNWDTGKRHVGLIAQDINTIAPYMVEEVFLGKTVSENKDGSETIIDPGEAYLTFDGTALTYMLINSVKEQQEIIDDQQAQIDDLKTQLSLLIEEIKSNE